MRLAFVDCETTGLDPDRHEVWEVGLILREVPPADRIPTATNIAAADVESHWLLPVHRLGQADPKALEIGRFHDRHPQGHGSHGKADRLVPTPLDTFADEFAWLTKGAHLVGAVVSFDEERLRRLLQRHNALPEWHYHLVDVEALAAGRLGIPPPWNSGDLTATMGIYPSANAVHTAMGDARWARDLYDAVMHVTTNVPPRVQDHVCTKGTGNQAGTCVICHELVVPHPGLVQPPADASRSFPGSGFAPIGDPEGSGW
jgi:hypothetical protein